MFLLTPFTQHERTCYYQLYFEDVRMSFGEFGVKPAQYVKTFNDARFLGLTLDALNLENSMIAAMNSDFANSVMPHVALFSMAAASNDNQNVTSPRRGRTIRHAQTSNNFFTGTVNSTGEST